MDHIIFIDKYIFEYTFLNYIEKDILNGTANMEYWDTAYHI